MWLWTGYGFDIGFIDHLEIQAVTALPLISTLYSSPQHLLSLLQPAVSSPDVPWQRLLKVEILELPALRSFLRRLSFRTACQLFPRLNWIAMSSQPSLQSSTALSTTKPLLSSFMTVSHGLNRKHHSQQFLYCWLRIQCRRNLFAEPLPSNGRLLMLHYSSLQASCHNIFNMQWEPKSPYRRRWTCRVYLLQGCQLRVWCILRDVSDRQYSIWDFLKDITQIKKLKFNHPLKVWERNSNRNSRPLSQHLNF
jgi:hypothetical protein